MEVVFGLFSFPCLLLSCILVHVRCMHVSRPQCVQFVLWFNVAHLICACVHFVSRCLLIVTGLLVLAGFDGTWCNGTELWHSS